MADDQNPPIRSYIENRLRFPDNPAHDQATLGTSIGYDLIMMMILNVSVLKQMMVVLRSSHPEAVALIQSDIDELDRRLDHTIAQVTGRPLGEPNA